MAGFVQRIRLQLESAAPGFLTALHHIRLPPVDFNDALERAKAQLRELNIQTRPLSTTKAIATIKNECKLTFTFLTLQLHSRGDAQFWRDVDDKTLFAFLAFATIELFVDALTHTEPQRRDLDLVLTDLTEVAFCQELEQVFDRLIEKIRSQRSRHGDDWQPSSRHLEAVARAGRQDSWLTLSRIAAVTAILAVGGVVVYRYYRSRA